MDISLGIIAELYKVGQEYSKLASDKNAASLSYCETATKVSDFDCNVGPLPLCRTAFFPRAINGVLFSTHTFTMYDRRHVMIIFDLECLHILKYCMYYVSDYCGFPLAVDLIV